MSHWVRSSHKLETCELSIPIVVDSVTKKPTSCQPILCDGEWWEVLLWKAASVWRLRVCTILETKKGVRRVGGFWGSVSSVCNGDTGACRTTGLKKTGPVVSNFGARWVLLKLTRAVFFNLQNRWAEHPLTSTVHSAAVQHSAVTHLTKKVCENKRTKLQRVQHFSNNTQVTFRNCPVNCPVRKTSAVQNLFKRQTNADDTHLWKRKQVYLQ